MIDVNQITSTLRGMPDQQLQQYAMMHKGDPYILSLAVSESNQRKKMRMAAQGQAGGMPQPKVADAAIAGMAQRQLPEDQGIARIPAPNMQYMADGGIAGYGDGDDVPRQNGMAQGGMYDFAQRSEPVVRMSGGGAVQKFAGKGEQLVRTTDGGKTWFLDIPKTIRDPSVPYYRLIPNPAAKLADMKFPSKAAALEAVTTASTQYSGTPGAKPYSLDLGSALPTVDNMYATPEGKRFVRDAEMTDKEFNEEKKQGIRQNQIPTFAGPDAPIVPRFQPGVSDAFVPPVAAVPPAAAAVPGAAPAPVPEAKPDPNAGGVRDLLPAVNAAPSKALSIDDSAALGDKFLNSKARIGEINRQVLQEQMDANRAKENSIEALKAFNEKQGPAYAGYEKLLQKEELQDATDKEKAGLMSLMKGFLAMAAGESPNAATNIAKGAMAGLGDYGDALKEFKKAAKERNKEFQFIQQARRAEERGDFDKVQMYEDKATAANQASARFGIAAINDITNAGAKISSDIYNTTLSNISRENIAAMGERGATARANAQLNAKGQTERLVDRMTTDPKFAESYKNFASIGPDARGDQAIIAKYSGPQGQIALQLLEASGPEGKAQAQIIKQIIKQNTGAMLKPVNVAEALP